MSRNVRKRTLAPREDSNQTAHSRSLIWIFSGRILDCQVSSCEQRRLVKLRGFADWFVSSLGTHIRWYVFSSCGSNTNAVFCSKYMYRPRHYYFRVYVIQITIDSHCPKLQSGRFFILFEITVVWGKRSWNVKDIYQTKPIFLPFIEPDLSRSLSYQCFR